MAAMGDVLRCLACGREVETAFVEDATTRVCPWCLSLWPAGAPSTDPPTVPTTPAPLALDPSHRFGKFVLSAKVGSGGMGEVWKAWDTVLGRWVALKFLKSDDPEELARFRREAETAARLSHPNIAAIYEVAEEKGRHGLAMQLIEGTTLEKFPRRDRRLLARLVRDAAHAVGYAHRQGIVHRDLKPANLMVSHRGKGEY